MPALADVQAAVRQALIEGDATRGSNYLRPFAPACQRIDVAGLLEQAASALAAVQALGPERLGDFD